MSDKREKVVITLKIELPTEFAATLDDMYWIRLGGAIVAIIRMPLGENTNTYPSVWRER